MIYSPKTDIYTALNTLSAYVVQGAQSEFVTVPAITFTITDNSTELDLDNEVVSQTIIATVDIWTNSSSSATTLLSSVEQVMRNIGYRMTYSSDIPHPEGALHHINCRFETTR